MKNQADITAIKPMTHHLIISLAFLIFSSSHILRVSFNDPNAIANIAHRAKNPAIF